MILWLTGNSGAGKTTLARQLARRNTIILDGDDMRRIWPELGLSPEDRRINCLRIAQIARLLEDQGLSVIVAAIAPFIALRHEIDAICNPVWVYVPGGKEGEDYPYEPPADHLLVRP